MLDAIGIAANESEHLRSNEVIQQQHKNKVRGNRISQLLGALKKCGRSRELCKGVMIHAAAAENGDDANPYIANSLISMYARCGNLADAQRVFDAMLSRDVITWNSLLSGYGENGEAVLVLEIFARMQREAGSSCRADALTFVAAVKACSFLAGKEQGKEIDARIVKLKSLEMGMALHSLAAVNSCDEHKFVAASLVDMYSNCGSLSDAARAFGRIPQPDLVLWNVFMLGHSENGEGRRALEIFSEMRRQSCCEANERSYLAAIKACSSLAEREAGVRQSDGRFVKVVSLEKAMAIHREAAENGFADSDMFVASSLVEMYSKCGSLADARRVFEKISERGNLVPWNSMIQGSAENGDGELGLEIYQRLRAESFLKPDCRTYAGALKSCCNILELDAARAVHAEICRQGVEIDVILVTCLVDVYGKCGKIDLARLIFDAIARNVVENWTALMAAYSLQGETNQVLDLFSRMQDEGVKPNDVTFVCVLSSCSHAGLVERGKKIFTAMVSEFRISPCMQHYHCMVDMLGRANELEAALRLVSSMSLNPNAVTWMILLDACRKWKNVAVGRIAFEALISLDENEGAAYMLMANIYQSVGLLDERNKVQQLAMVSQKSFVSK